MTLANKLTFLRIILAPVFFAVYMVPVPENFSKIWVVTVLWVIFLVSEITDLLDGIAARRHKQSSDFGKFFDPFADTLMQLTCFLCFVISGLMPAWLFLIIMYREFAILFIRNLMQKKGITMGARFSGKVKTTCYIGTSAFALAYNSLLRLGIFDCLSPTIGTVIGYSLLAVFYVSAVSSIVSFIDYLLVYRKTA
ncbi:MAG: CDP-diacylglycerol--glycerol-3-phosphate 3-phosphatidyltransferase [Treponema sp.]|nr:CDP-diacylglycerol--glycerol-3-phosphate 3-phosphatidyltransferase [Treponema sp.]